MGRGIVPTPSDFGISGERPSHPELLDWLANDFVRHGWDQKRLHRMILLSRTYQQVSKRTPQQEAIDPENTLYGRMNLRRLEAEAIRDAILSVVDRLSQQIGGPSVPVTENAEGKVVIGRRKIRDGLKAEVNSENADAFRRSVFIEVQRRLPLNVLATFDQPAMNPNCDLRRPSTVATQALWFLNDSMLVQRSEELAKLLFASNSPTDDTDGRAIKTRIDELFTRLFAVTATPQELATCVEFLAAQRKHFSDQQPDDTQQPTSSPKLRAMAALCQTLLASNRFLHVD